MSGATIGRYELFEKLGDGGMGVVYRARDVLLHSLLDFDDVADIGLSLFGNTMLLGVRDLQATIW